MSKKPFPKIKKVSRGQRNTAGVYGFDNGDIAFGNPLDRIGKKASQRAQARERWKENGSEARKNKSNEKANFHLKHG